MSNEIVIPESEKGYRCEVVLDSLNPVGARLTTMRLKYPLIVHAEMCRHRAFSRSVASNRAIPTTKIVAMVEQDPFVPIYWGKNQSGMQAEEELQDAERAAAIDEWYLAMSDAIGHVKSLARLGLHKQIVNRLLMPFQWVTEIVSATDWQNFFVLRCHPAAQPEVREIAERMRKVYQTSRPGFRGQGQWHLPLIREEEWDQPLETLKQISAARCARTSYRTHEGKVSIVEEDVQLYGRLVGSVPRHASPTEHQAMALATNERIGNLRGWRQHRYELPDHMVED